jgi:hypothetical protein
MARKPVKTTASKLLKAMEHVFTSMERIEKQISRITIKQNDLEDVLKDMIRHYTDVKKFEGMFLRERGKEGPRKGE